MSLPTIEGKSLTKPGSNAARMSPWFVDSSAPAAPTSQVFCFHHAGGNASLFRTWSRGLPAEIRLTCVQLPGRGNRLFEPCLETVEEIIETIWPEFSQTAKTPFFLLGHSLGGLLAFELARRCETANLPIQRLVVSAIRSPQAIGGRNTRRRYAEMTEPELLADLAKLGGTPVEFFEHAELRELILPAIRADYRILDRYSYQDSPRLRIPISVWVGDEDAETPVLELAGWRDCTEGACDFQSFPGGHFYLSEQESSVLAALRSLLENHARSGLNLGRRPLA